MSLRVSAPEPAPTEAVDTASLTPMLKQYLETKAQVPGALLFFRLGDFYELFFEDAVRAAEVLQITLTSRAKGAERIPMCGVPYHAARRYIAKLIDHGHKVAVCEQTEPPGKGLVRREVVRVITPGMVLDDDVLEARENNFLAALLPPLTEEAPWGGALIDASTGEFVALAPGPFEVIIDEVARTSPREVLLPEGLEPQAQDAVRAAFLRRPALAVLPADAFDEKRATALLKAHFQVATLDGFGVSGAGPSLGAAGAALRYLKETQKSPAAHVDRLALQSRGGVLVLDETSRTNLELLRNAQDGGRAGSLLSVVDRSVTALGARKLARWLVAPLADVAAIEARLGAVEEAFQAATWREELVRSAQGRGRHRAAVRPALAGLGWPARSEGAGALARRAAFAGPRRGAGQGPALPGPGPAAVAPRRAGPGRAARAGAGRRAAPGDGGRRLHSRRLPPGARRDHRPVDLGQGLAGEDRGPGARGHRHRLAEDPPQQRLRLLPGGDEGQPAPRARRGGSASRPWPPASATSPRSSRPGKRRC